MIRNHVFFSGGIDKKTGELKNMRELRMLCPEEFKDLNNVWRKAAEKVLAAEPGVNMRNWIWKDKKEWGIMVIFFRALVEDTKCPKNDLSGITAWMMSEMLEGIPDRILGYDEEEERPGRPMEPQSGMSW